MMRFTSRRFGSTAILTLALLLLLAGGARAEVKTTVDHNDNDQVEPEFKFKHVPSPSKTDAATNAKFSIVDGERDPAGGDLDVLHDGLLPTEQDEPAANFFFDAGTEGGRIGIDLGSVIRVQQINTYSWHPNTRGPQMYKLYAADGKADGFKADPKKGVDPTTVGWKLIATVDTRPKEGDGGGQYGVSTADRDPAKAIGEFRYVLIDTRRTEETDDFGNTFFSEIDVVEAKGDAGQRQPSKPAKSEAGEGKGDGK